MSILAAMSDHDIIDRCQSGELVYDISRTDRNAADPGSLFNRCIALHNGGQLELLHLTDTRQFAELVAHAFFKLQHFLCEAIPKLESPPERLMQTVMSLVDRAGNDGAAYFPNVALLLLCHKRRRAVAFTRGEDRRQQGQRGSIAARSAAICQRRVAIELGA